TVLTQAYEAVLSPYNLVTAQALLTINDTENRRRWMNAKATLSTLLTLGAIPIINENDTVATDEIRYGDNDRLAARVAQMVEADLLILLSDIDGLYDQDPTENPEARHIPLINELTPEIIAMGAGIHNGKTKNMGSGGMATKLQAAKIATRAGCTMVIAKGTLNHPLTALDNNTVKSSWFTATTNPLAARKQWIAGSLKSSGRIMVDEGAARALRTGKSLLCAGVTTIEGSFNKGDAVVICDKHNAEIARGLSSYNSEQADLVKGLKSRDIQSVLGYDSGSPLVHRDNMVLTS
ncbi:MAG: glutamate 5-kinase, partial [Robiginitomaculum sp.]|nr:glutamate 5-kinase [Robiginitomaculum sp.]